MNGNDIRRATILFAPIVLAVLALVTVHHFTASASHPTVDRFVTSSTR